MGDDEPRVELDPYRGGLGDYKQTVIRDELTCYGRDSQITMEPGE